MSNKKVVYLVDDDPTFLETTKIALEAKYDIKTAKDGKECLENASSIKPNLIILDVMMRHFSEGVDVADKLKKDSQTKDIPIIILTGVNEVFEMDKEVDKEKYSYDLWLEKPVEPDVLLKEVDKLIS